MSGASATIGMGVMAGRRNLGSDAVAAILLLLLGLTTLPAGGNRPVFWMGVTTATAAAAIVFAIANRRDTQVTLFGVRAEAAMLILTCAWIAIQLLPIGSLLPPIKAVSGAALSFPAISLAPGDSWLMLLQLAGFGIFAFLIWRLAVSARRRQAMLLGVFAIAAAQAVFGLVNLNLLGDTLFGVAKKTDLGLATGSFVNHNSYANFLAMGLCAGISLLLGGLLRPGAKPVVARVMGAAVTGVGVALVAGACFASGSRMGIFSAIAGALVTATVSLVGAGWRPARLFVAIVLGGLAAFVLVFTLFGSAIEQRALTSLVDDEGRFELYAQVWQMIVARPFTGYGAGAFASAFPLFQHPPLHGELVWDNAHSTYLALWAELGLVAGSLPLICLVTLGVRILHRLNAGPTSASAALGALTVAALHSLLDFSLEVEANALLFLTIVLMATPSAERLARASHSRHAAP